MTPEKLKLLAETISPDWMKIEIIDWKPHHYRQAYPNVKIPCDPYVRRNGSEFNPESNPAQREEVLLWLLGKDWDVCKEDGVYVFWRPTCQRGRQQTIRDKDYTTALMMAAEKELGD